MKEKGEVRAIGKYCEGTSVVEPELFFTVPVPTFEKLWFRFWFQLLKSYGSGSGSYF